MVLRLWFDETSSDDSRTATMPWCRLREPAERCVSEFFHSIVSRKGVEPSEAQLIGYMEHCSDHLSHYVAERKLELGDMAASVRAAALGHRPSASRPLSADSRCRLSVVSGWLAARRRDSHGIRWFSYGGSAMVVQLWWFRYARRQDSHATMPWRRRSANRPECDPDPLTRAAPWPSFRP